MLRRLEKEERKRLSKSMEKIKEIATKKRMRIAMLMICDIIVLTISSFLAIALRFDFHDIPKF